MKTQRNPILKRGFTLMELMVAMAITTIIVTVLVSITSIALDTWNRSRSELRASRQGKSLVDTMARDFESMVVRRGNKSQWLTAIKNTKTVGSKIESSNAAELIFFTAATDRYNGQIGGANDKGGDVSCVAYRLAWNNPINPNSNDFETFVLNRLLVDPDGTFTSLLGKEDLINAFLPYENQVSDPANFVCENIYQFSVTFHVMVSKVSGTTTSLVDVPVTIGKSTSTSTATSFKVLGSGIDADVTTGDITKEELAGGRIAAMEVSVTVITDFGIDQLRNRTFTASQQADFLAKNSYQYTKLVQLPSM